MANDIHAMFGALAGAYVRKAASLELLKSLLDQCYDAIATAIYSEDGYDDVELLEAIEEVIGETNTVKKWKEPRRET